MPRFLCALWCEWYLLQSVGRFTGRAWSSSEPNAYINPKGGSPESSLQAGAHREHGSLWLAHTVINRGFKDRPQLWNSCRKKFILLSEAMQRRTSQPICIINYRAVTATIQRHPTMHATIVQLDICIAYDTSKSGRLTARKYCDAFVPTAHLFWSNNSPSTHGMDGHVQLSLKFPGAEKC